MVVDNTVGVGILLAAGQGVHGRPLLRILAQLEDDFAAEDACQRTVSHGR